MNPAFKRLIIAGLLVLIVLGVVEMFAYDIIKINWITFMQIQPAFPADEPSLAGRNRCDPGGRRCL